ncbi:MAG: hypothetical protein OEW45_21715 [Deltaproteobacteria bacterium]|nr:hypothetical protein [Deltaproteobacteria bacterium]
MGRPFLITDKHVTFLRLILKYNLNHHDAYLEAGFKAKTIASAASCASQLLKKLKKHEDYQEIIKAFNPYFELAQDISDLRKCADPRIRLGACSVAGKWLGMQKEEPPANFGFQVIIGGRQPTEVGAGQDQVQVQAPKKPIALLK